jgi:hypothetical protein
MEFILTLPSELEGFTLNRVTQALIDGCPDRLPDCVSIDFSGLTFIKPAGVTFLSNLIRWLTSKNVSVHFVGHNDNSDALRFLDDSLFFETHLGGKLSPLANPRPTTRPLVHARHERCHEEIRDRFVPWLSNRLGISKTPLHNFQVCLLELFNNIQDHSSLEIGCLFAQHYPNIDQVAVALADFGIGIPSAVRRIHPQLNDNEAIIQAVQRGFTSGAKPRNGGEGLSLLLDNVVGRNGLVTIYSLSGAVTFSARAGVIQSTPRAQGGFYPGTTIDIWLRTDTLEYLDDEPEVLEW